MESEVKSRTVLVTGFDHPALYGSVIVFTGVDEKEGVIRFGADHRVAPILMRAIAENKVPVAEVPEWAVL